MKWLLGVMLALGLGGCSKLDYTKVSGDGAVIEQRHPLGQQVTRVLAGVPANIHLVAGDASGIHIRGQGNLLPYLELTEKGDKLEIEVKEGYRLEPPEPIDITITLPKVEELALAGLARGDLSGFSGDELVLSVAGLGDIVASQLALDRLEGNIAGAGSLDLGEGSARGSGAQYRRCRWRVGRAVQRRGGRGQYRRQWRRSSECQRVAEGRHRRLRLGQLSGQPQAGERDRRVRRHLPCRKLSIRRDYR